METTVLVALGSNRRHGRHGRPEAIIAAAVAELTRNGLTILAVSRTHATAPIGPGGRRFANAAVAVSSPMPLPALLDVLKAIEASFGRRGGKRWGDRVLDLDIVGAGTVRFASRRLNVPHPRFVERRFVLDPLVEIAPDWRPPGHAATVRQLRFRAMRPKARA